MEEQNKKLYKAHVLALPYPSQGHINPILQFCKRLVSKNIKATLANTVSVSKTMIINPNTPVVFETISDGFDEPGSSGPVPHDVYMARFRVIGSQTLTTLIQKLADSGHPVDAIIYDAFLPWPLDVAKELGLVGVAFFTQTCTVNAIYYYVYRGILKLPLSDLPVVIHGLPALQPWEMPSFVYRYGLYPDVYDTMVNQYSNIDKTDWVLFDIFYDAEKEVVDTLKKLWKVKVKTIGPTLPSKYLDNRLEHDKDYGFNLYKPDSTACLNWLDTKPNKSVIYISYGSFAKVQEEQIEEVAYCLKELDYNFLWVVRGSEEPKLPSFVSEMTEKGLVVRWSPQLNVLSSNSIGGNFTKTNNFYLIFVKTGCFVTHCGLNSVLEAMCLGVGIVAVPLWSDQTTNAKYVEDVWGIGVRARKDERGIVKREMLGESIREVMSGKKRDEIEKNLVKWKGLARDAVDEGGSSDTNIDEFVSALARS